MRFGSGHGEVERGEEKKEEKRDRWNEHKTVLLRACIFRGFLRGALNPRNYYIPVSTVRTKLRSGPTRTSYPSLCSTQEARTISHLVARSSRGKVNDTVHNITSLPVVGRLRGGEVERCK